MTENKSVSGQKGPQPDDFNTETDELLDEGQGIRKRKVNDSSADILRPVNTKQPIDMNRVITSTEDMIKQDFNTMLIRFAENFVSNDQLRKNSLLEELTKFRQGAKIELENLQLRERIDQLKQETKHHEENSKNKIKAHDDELSGLRRDLDNEIKDKLIVMNQMIKSMETEKNTRIRAYAFLTREPGDTEAEEAEFASKNRDHLAQNYDDVEFFKAKLLEKIGYMEEETVMRINMRNFNKRVLKTDEGLAFFGHPRSLDHVYEVVGKIKQGSFPHKSAKKRAALEEIAVYVQFKPVTFLRHFGFVQTVTDNMHTLDKDVQEIILFILARLGQDSVLATEIFEEGGYFFIRKFLKSTDFRIKLMALAAFNPLCNFEDLHKKLDKKDIVGFAFQLEDYLEINFSYGILLIWSIFRKISRNANCRQWMMGAGILRFVSRCIDLSHSQVLANNILKTLLSVCEDENCKKFATGPKLVESLLKLLETCDPSNVLLVVDIIGYTGVESAARGHESQSRSIIQRILEIGISSQNSIKFAILKVTEKMFSQKNKIIASKLNSERIMLLIISALNHGRTDIKETATRLALKMVITENLDMSQEPDLLGLVLLNCKLHDKEYFDLRRLSIEIIFRLAVSSAYSSLIIINAHQVLDMCKTTLSLLHPEISSGASQSTFLLFDRVTITDNLDDAAMADLKDEEIMNFAARVQGFRDRILQDISLKNPEALNKKKDQGKAGKKDKKKDTNTETIAKFTTSGPDIQAQEYSFDSMAASDEEALHGGMSAFASPEETRIIEVTKALVNYYDDINQANPMRRIDLKSAEVYVSTYHLIKVTTILLSCDITYSKVFGMSLHAISGIILEKAIGAREMVVVDALVTFFVTLFDIIYFRNGSHMTDALSSLISIMCNRFVIKILKILKKELDSIVSNHALIASTLSLILRLLLSEESALTLSKFGNLGPVLEKIIEKGIEIKSPNILLLASVLGTHMSIYPNFQAYLFNRDFIAYLMGLLEPAASEYIQAWGANGQNTSEILMAGEGLLFVEKIMANTSTIIQLTSLMLNNLCHQNELSKILGSLPIKYGVKPLAKIFLIDKTKVSKLIQCLCLDTDFQSKMISFIPVDFKVNNKEIEEADNYDKGSQGAQSLLYQKYKVPVAKKKDKGEEELRSPYEEMRELIYDPRSMRVTKGKDYHEKISKVVFGSLTPDDFMWRRVLKASVAGMREEQLKVTTSVVFTSRLIKPLRLAIDDEYVRFEDMHQIERDWEAREEFYCVMGDELDEILPDESLSGIMKASKIYPPSVRVPKPKMDYSAQDLPPGHEKRVYDYKLDDANMQAADLLRPTRPSMINKNFEDSFATPTGEAPRREIQQKVKDELDRVQKSDK